MVEPLKSILIVEDSHEIRVVVRDALEADGWIVFSAANGKTGLEILRNFRTPPCLVLLDARMPIMDGREMLDQLTDTERQNLNIVMMSAHAKASDYPEAKEFLQKPFDVGHLISTAEKYCGRT